jgi:hypothetical protein
LTTADFFATAPPAPLPPRPAMIHVSLHIAAVPKGTGEHRVAFSFAGTTVAE